MWYLFPNVEEKRCTNSEAGWSKGEPDRGRAPHAGSCAHAEIDTPEVFGVAGGRVHQGQECDISGQDMSRSRAKNKC